MNRRRLAAALLLALALRSPVAAEETATYVTVPLPEAPVVGTLISDSDSGYLPTATAYDDLLFGVVSGPPQNGTVPIVASGVAAVRVSLSNGAIAPGDLITASDKAGLGQKATHWGTLLGVALQAASGSTGEEATINVALGLHRGEPRPRQTTSADSTPTQHDTTWQAAFAGWRSAAEQNPALALRHALAAIVVYGSLLVACYTFIRAASAGIIALGRNPLARFSIWITILINVVLTAAVVGAGIWFGWQVLRWF